jgi:PAS domain S-box-containing protein
MLAICTYSLKKCSTSEIIDVVHSHQFAIVRREGKWERFENIEQIKAEKKYRTLFESSADGITLLDMEGEIKDCNPSFCTITGYSKEELLSLNFRDITPKKWILKEQELINKQLLTNGYTEAYEKEIRGKNGNIIPISVRIWLKQDEEENPTGMWAFLRDITERKQAERRLKQLVTTVSHELRTPLTILTSSVEKLKAYYEKISKEDKTKLLDMIYTNTDFLNEIIEDILMVSKLDKKKVDMHWSNFCPLEICNDVIKLMDLRLKAKNLTISLKVPEDLQIFADKRVINQLFQILIDNAIKYSYKNSEIEIKMKDDFVPQFNTFHPKGVLFEIKDHGIGIKEDELPNIFKRFYRSNEVNEIPGTGLGLSIAKELALLHEGKVFVDSEYGKGSTFSLFLPKKD